MTKTERAFGLLGWLISVWFMLGVMVTDQVLVDDEPLSLSVRISLALLFYAGSLFMIIFTVLYYDD